MSNTITCSRCMRSRRAVVDTDGMGGLVDLTPPCACEGKRICQDCGALFDGAKNAKYCPEHKRVRRNANNVRCQRNRKARDPEGYREYQRKARRRYRANHPEVARAIVRRSQQKHREKHLERARQYRLENLERLREYDRQRNQGKRNEERKEAGRLEREIRRRARERQAA